MNAPVETARSAAKRCASPASASRPTSVVEVFNPYNERGGRHRAGGAARACARGVRQGQGLQAEADPLRAPAILLRTAEILRDRKEEFARLITAESGLCWKDSLYEASRAYDVWSFAGQLTIKDDGEIYACDISPNGKQRKIFTTRMPLLGVISAITPFNHPLNMVPQAGAGDRHQQPRRAEADRADAADRARARRRALRGRAAAGDAVGRDRQSLDHGRRHDHRPGLPTSSPSPARCGSANTSPRRPATGASCSSSAATIR